MKVGGHHFQLEILAQRSVNFVSHEVDLRIVGREGTSESPRRHSLRILRLHMQCLKSNKLQ